MKAVRKASQDWTAADIAAFWDWQSKNAHLHQQYFTAVMAPSLVQFMKSKGLLKGHVLDYGCGAGHLLEQLVKQPGAVFYGLDFSAESLADAARRTAGSPVLKELVLADTLPTKFTGEQFDTIALIETIEHLQDEVLHQTMRELYRILKPGGKIFITTPFNEDLEQHLNFCPFCKSEFHQMQHMQSFNVKSLSSLAYLHGFKTEICTSMDIEKIRFGKTKYFIKQLLKKVAIAAGLQDAVRDKIPNLVALLVKA